MLEEILEGLDWNPKCEEQNITRYRKTKAKLIWVGCELS